jgi:hypothetical protein
MNTSGIDELLSGEPDTFWDAPPLQSEKSKRKRTEGPFYHCPEAWADTAAGVAGHHLILALRLYRRWRKRPPKADRIAVTAHALGGPWHSRRGRQYVVAKLEEAGLIEVVERKPGCAPKVRVIEIPDCWTSTPR